MDADVLIRQLNFNLRYAESLVADLDEAQMCAVPGPGLENHPAFTLGHLATGANLMVEDLGAGSDIPELWVERFQRRGPGDPRLPEPGANPGKAELLAELKRQHDRLKAAILAFPAERWQEPFSWRFKTYMPTTADLALFLCVNHEAMHLGQLAAWRRGMGLPSALATL